MQSGREAADAPVFEEYLNSPKETAPADAPVFEEYLNSPKETAPAELLTEICLPLV